MCEPQANGDTTREWTDAIAVLRSGLDEALGALVAACAWPAARLAHRPAPDAWSPAEVLEHVALTDHFLLLLLDKIADKAQRRRNRGVPWPAHPPRFEHIQELAPRERGWDAPAHMRPTGEPTIDHVRTRLVDDRRRALALLDAFPCGEGTLHRIRMSEVGGDDDRLDLYQYLELLRVHASRHVRQLGGG